MTIGLHDIKGVVLMQPNSQTESRKYVPPFFRLNLFRAKDRSRVKISTITQRRVEWLDFLPQVAKVTNTRTSCQARNFKTKTRFESFCGSSQNLGNFLREDNSSSLQRLVWQTVKELLCRNIIRFHKQVCYVVVFKGLRSY